MNICAWKTQTWLIDKCYLRRYRLPMGKVRRGGYIFVTWKGDPLPRHVHVYRDGILTVKWDLDNDKPMIVRQRAEFGCSLKS
jgi:hypothetical protein